MRTLTITLLFTLLSLAAFATSEKKLIKIRATAPGGYVDETSIYFDLGLSPSYISNQDAEKVYSQLHNSPSLYSVTSDNVFCSINGYSPLTVSEVIPLGIKTDTAGTYLFTASVLTNFDSTSIIQLEDRQENILADLRMAFYAVTLADSQTINGRFFLHVSRPIMFTPITAGCANNDGALAVDQDNTIVWNGAWLYDSLGVLIDSLSNTSTPYSFTALSEGAYSIMIKFGDYAVTKSFFVPGNYVVAHIEPSSLTAIINQELIFRSITHNATIFQWDLGDSTRITGVANPDYAYLQPGYFEVVLTASDEAGCTFRDSVWVTVSAISGITTINAGPRKVWAYDKTVTVVLNEEISQGAELKIYNVLGQPVYYSPVTDITTEIKLNDVPMGYYIVSLQNNQVESTKRVFLGK